MAISWGDKKLTRTLLDAQVKVNIVHGQEKTTPLHLLAITLRDVELGQRLLTMGARLDAYAGPRGFAPLHDAILPAYMRARYGGSVPGLMSADEAKNAFLLMKHGADINAVDNDGNTPCWRRGVPGASRT